MVTDSSPTITPWCDACSTPHEAREKVIYLCNGWERGKYPAFDQLSGPEVSGHLAKNRYVSFYSLLDGRWFPALNSGRTQGIAKSKNWYLECKLVGKFALKTLNCFSWCCKHRDYEANLLFDHWIRKFHPPAAFLRHFERLVAGNPSETEKGCVWGVRSVHWQPDVVTPQRLSGRSYGTYLGKLPYSLEYYTLLEMYHKTFRAKTQTSWTRPIWWCRRATNRHVRLLRARRARSKFWVSCSSRPSIYIHASTPDLGEMTKISIIVQKPTKGSLYVVWIMCGILYDNLWERLSPTLFCQDDSSILNEGTKYYHSDRNKT